MARDIDDVDLKQAMHVLLNLSEKSKVVSIVPTGYVVHVETSCSHYVNNMFGVMDSVTNSTYEVTSEFKPRVS